jgi:hypothetical protein
MHMKKLAAICVCLASVGALGLPKEAAAWDYVLTSGTPTWLSDTTVPTGLSEYDYAWTLTQAQILVDLPGGAEWQDILDLLDIAKSGSGTKPVLPFTLDPIEIRLNGAEPVVTGDILLGAAVPLPGQGFGAALLESLVLGSFGGYEVLDAQFGGAFTVTPEPATVLLLSLGSLVLLRKRQGGRWNSDGRSGDCSGRRIT